MARVSRKQVAAVTDKSQTPLTELARAFEVYNRTTNKSPRTVHWYNDKLELFNRFLGGRGVLADVTIPTVRSYIADLQSRDRKHVNNPLSSNQDGPLSSSYIAGFARSLRAFSSWLYEDGYTDTNVLKNLRPPKIQQKVVQPLSDDEVRKLLAVFDREDPFGARNHAIVFMMLDCGLRGSEVCDLTLEDAHIKQGYLKILGKGNKERLVPIGRATQDVLARWRDRVRPKFDLQESPFLFLDYSGARLSLNGLEQMVRKAATAAGLRRIHCHLLRHTFATSYLVKEVGDPLRLQQVLGHTSLEMVRRYVAMASVQQSLIDGRSSPMDLILGEQQPKQRGVRPPSRPRVTLVAGR
jgi:integrase/recombinase XerC